MSVLLYIENTEGKFKKAAFELASYGATLAEQKSAKVIAITVGNVDEAEAQKLGKYGVNILCQVTDASMTSFNAKNYAMAIAKAAAHHEAEYVLFQNNYNGMSIAPRVAVRLKASLIPAVVSLPASYEPFTVRKKAYSGKAFANVTAHAAAKVITLNSNSYQLVERPVAIEVKQSALAVDNPDTQLTVKQVDRIRGKVPVTEAELIVSGGRGLKGPENWHLVENLADLIGASTACSKPVADIEWRPHSEHVGQTGKFVSPNLYIAIGISGAIQHLAGISSSKVIVAINNDPEAPIFEAADYGIVGDAFEVVPKFTEAVRAIKNH